MLNYSKFTDQELDKMFDALMAVGDIIEEAYKGASTPYQLVEEYHHVAYMVSRIVSEMRHRLLQRKQ